MKLKSFFLHIWYDLKIVFGGMLMAVMLVAFLVLLFLGCWFGFTREVLLEVALPRLVAMIGGMGMGMGVVTVARAFFNTFK